MFRMGQKIAMCDLIAFVASNASAQYGLSESKDGTVTCTGSSFISRAPTILRLQLDMEVKGKNVKEAMTKLSDRKDAAKATLLKLGVAADSIKFGEPRLAGDSASQEAQMRRMVMSKLQGSKKKKSAEKSVPVKVSCNLSAEWNLKGSKVDELIVEAHDLMEKVRSADLAGSAEDKDADSEEEEEESAGNESRVMYNYPGQVEATPGSPSFIFATPISDDDREATIREAFGKAKADAQRLATAAGVQLGSLRSASAIMSGGDGDESYSPMSRYMLQASRQGGRNADGTRSEATSRQFGEVTYRVIVNASFSLENGKKSD